MTVVLSKKGKTPMFMTTGPNEERGVLSVYQSIALLDGRQGDHEIGEAGQQG